MPKFLVEDTKTGREYEFEGDREPTQTEVEDYLQGTIKEYKPNTVEKVGNWLTESVEKRTVPTEVITPWTKEPEKVPTKEVDIPRWHKLVETGVDAATIATLSVDAIKTIWNLPHAQYLLSKVAFRPATAGTPGTATQIDTTRVRKGMGWLGKVIAPEHPAFKPLPTREEKIASVAEYYRTKPPEVKPAKTGEEELTRYNQWLQSKEATQRPELNVPLHPAPATSIDYTKPIALAYPNVPKSVSKTLPSEIISPPTQEEVTKTLSRFPQRVMDQKSLEEVGNAMAKEMGIIAPVNWIFQTDKYAHGEMRTDFTKGKETGSKTIVVWAKEGKGVVPGKKAPTKTHTYANLEEGEKGVVAEGSQGRLKKIIVHELSHITSPQQYTGTRWQSHHTMFQDEVDYHEAATLIKRELVKQKSALTDKLGLPIIESNHYAGYKVPKGVLVYDAYGQPIETFESEVAANRWIKSTEAEKQKLVSKEKPEPRASVETLIDKPERAAEVLSNPTAHDEDTVMFAKEIVRDYQDKTPPQVPVEKVGEISKQGIAVPPKVNPVTQVEETTKPSAPLVQSTETGIYNPDQNYNVTYLKMNGSPAVTTIKGGLLNTMDQQLKSGKNTVDPYGSIVMKITDVYPIQGDSGRVLLPEWEAAEDALTNLVGEAQVGKEKYLNFISKLAVPEKVDNPLFRPIYNAVQHGVDYRTELTITGLKLLNPKEILSLPEADKAGLSAVIKVGNALHKEYSPDELKATFNLNDRQISAYNKIRRMYSYAFNETIKARKIQSEYETLKPEDKAAFDKAVEETNGKLTGYVAQERLGSGEKPWAVFKPGDKPEDRFFAVFSSKAEAERTAKALGDPGFMYLRKNIVNKITNRLSLSDLEELIDSADVSDTVEINAIRNEIKKRGALHHEVRRLDIPGYDWSLDSIVNSAIDYLEGGSNRLARTFGKKLAEGMFRQNVDNMSTEMRIFSRDFIDSAYNTGSIGFRNIGKMLYTWNLALNTKWLVMNGTQPLVRTYPVMARYLGTGKVEGEFTKAYDIAGRYLKYTTGKGKQGLSSSLLYSLNKLHNQGVLGDQATRLMMGVNSIRGEQVERIIGAYGRFGEFINRTHAAAAAYSIGTSKLQLEGKPLVEFMRQFVYRTQEAYGKHNLPLAITRAGDWASFLKMLYTFQHYNLANLQYINSTMPWHRGAKAGETTRALGSLLAVGGIKGLPLIGTGMALYALWKKSRREGGSLDYDMRKMLTDKEVPKGMQDALLEGIPTLAGMSLSSSTRPDLPFVEPEGKVDFSGVPGGMAEKVYNAGTLLKRGEVGRAMERLSPRALESIQKAIRLSNQGLTKANGELLLGKDKLGWWDLSLTAMGFTPNKITKAYEGENVKRSFIEARNNASSDFNERLAKAIFSNNDEGRRKVMQELREFNAKATPEQRISLNFSSVYGRVREMRGRDTGTPRRLRRKFQELEEVYK